MSILALVSEGTNQSNQRGSVRDTNMWKVASEVADYIAYVSGIGINQHFSVLRLATGWGAKAKSVQLVKAARECIAQLDEPVVIVGFGGSRGTAVLLKACTILELPVHAAVLFDAVYSFGLPWWNWLDKKLWPQEIPGNIDNALHIVAEHESTPGFAPTLYPARHGLRQVKTEGDHTEVLRGLEAERIALAWLQTLGIEARFKAGSNGWEKPTRHLDGLGYYWGPAS